MSARIAAMAALLLLNMSVGQAQPAGQAQSPTSSDPWFRQSAKPKDFALAKIPWRAFTIELPKDWQVSPGYGGVLFSASEKTKNNLPAATIVLEQMKLAVPLTRNEIDDGLAGFEANAAKQRDPAGQDFSQQVKDINGRRFVLVRYSRPGFSGTDAVVQYAIPSGTVMYRVICVAPSALLPAKYQATFAHVASSFKIAATTN